jgi:signal transduction histidine kinase
MVVARVALLVMVALLTLVATREPWELVWIGLLALAAAPGLMAPRHRVIGPLARLAEVLILCLAAESVVEHAVSAPASLRYGAAALAVLPYLLVPVAAAAIYQRWSEALGLVGIAAVALGVLAATGHLLTDISYLAVCAQWLLISALAVAVVVAIRHNLRTPRLPTPQPYAEATRLLTQLRTVARQLPGATLDPGGLAEHLLDEVRRVARVHRAAVLSAGGGSRLVVIAQFGVDRIDWETALDSDSAIADAWASQQPQIVNRSQSRSHLAEPGRAAGPGGEVSALVVPLLAGVRTVGLLAIEADVAGAYPPSVVARVAALAAPAALRLEAALLFDEVRALATNEERQRLAREIHDGVAQELVMVGYGIDNAMAVLPDNATDALNELRTLRGEVTRVITELRLSLFELRSDVDRHGGLTAAIAEYARAVGASAGLRVHLSLAESTARLPAATEAELLRIAQEAITNARKHAGAHDLWVTCEVDPPFAQIEVSDDGHGISDLRPKGRYGLAIMEERAQRIRGRLEIRPRQPSGTTVAVVLGSSPRRGDSE